MNYCKEYTYNQAKFILRYCIDDSFCERVLCLREDVVTEGNCRDSILRNARKTMEEYFVAPPGLFDMIIIFFCFVLICNFTFLGNVPLKNKE